MMVLVAMIGLAPAPATPLDRAPPVDACKLASPDQIRAVLTQRPFQIRSKAEKPKPGRGICTWSAYDPGLTADAPPAASIAVEVYRSDDPAWMARNFSHDFRTSLVPSQVRTDDAGDLVARPQSESVAVRHGETVVVVGADHQEYGLQEAPDRIYRLETLALQLSGAAVRGPVDVRSTQDACTPLDQQRVLGVLTLEPSSLEISRDGIRCTMQVKDGSGQMGHWADNRGEVQIVRNDEGTNARALDFQKRQTPFMPASTLVRTADPADRLLTSPDQPGEIWAVHGANYVALEVENETAAARSAPGWLYRVQRLAFEAAGATIIPTPGTPPDPVVPRPVDDKTPADAQSMLGGTTNWTPPAHPAPALSWLTDPIVATIAFLAAWRMFLMIAFVGGPIVLIAIAGSRASKTGAKSRLGAWPMLLLPIGILNVMVGPWLASLLVYHGGVSGSATVTGSRATSTQYNNQNVEAHTVLIRTADGKVVETGFEDDDFNVYPSRNQTYYPGEGDVFTVRYLRHAPGTFVIVADDDSPWALHRRCARIEQALSDAGAKLRFAPYKAEYKAAYQRASDAAHKGGCSGDD